MVDPFLYALLNSIQDRLPPEGRYWFLISGALVVGRPISFQNFLEIDRANYGLTESPGDAFVNEQDIQNTIQEIIKQSNLSPTPSFYLANVEIHWGNQMVKSPAAVIAYDQVAAWGTKIEQRSSWKHL